MPTAATWRIWPAGRPNSPEPPAPSPPSHLASHLRDGWAHPLGTETFTGAIRLADYLIEHAQVVFDLMGADPRIDDARWLLDWISRTNQVQFSRRDAHRAARGPFRKATDLEPALALLEEHGWVRRVDADPAGPKGGRPPSPRFLVNPLHPTTEPQPSKPRRPTSSEGSEGSVARGRSPHNEGRSARRGGVRRVGHGCSSSIWAVTLSNDNGSSRSRPCWSRSRPAGSGLQEADHGRAAAGVTVARQAFARPRPAAIKSGGGWTTAPKAPSPSTPAAWPATSRTNCSPRSLRTLGPTHAAAATCSTRANPLVAALVFQPTAQAPRAWRRQKVTCAATYAPTRPPPAPPDHPLNRAALQNELEGKLSHSGVMACRSILLRILEAARRERLIPTNPVRDVEAPKPRINPDRIFGHERRRTFTPDEFGRSEEVPDGGSLAV